MQLVSNPLRVLHYPQIPCKPFSVDVEDEIQAAFLIKVLAEQHLFLFDNNFIPDYSNSLSVVMQEHDGEGNLEWVDYWNDAEGMDFDEFVDEYITNH